MGLGFRELVVILVIVLLVFGAWMLMMAFRGKNAEQDGEKK